jgi:uncharacterized protein YacL (UPF0231 family)
MTTPTPRTDAAVKLTFAAGHNTVCPNFARGLERELTALTAERDQLRARAERAEANETVALAHWNKELERAMKAEAELVRACEVEQELRAEVKRMTHAYEYDHKCLCEVQDRCHLWKQRAVRAEAKLAKKSPP